MANYIQRIGLNSRRVNVEAPPPVCNPLFDAAFVPVAPQVPFDNFNLKQADYLAKVNGETNTIIGVAEGLYDFSGSIAYYFEAKLTAVPSNPGMLQAWGCGFADASMLGGAGISAIFVPQNNIVIFTDTSGNPQGAPIVVAESEARVNDVFAVYVTTSGQVGAKVRFNGNVYDIAPFTPVATLAPSGSASCFFVEDNSVLINETFGCEIHTKNTEWEIINLGTPLPGTPVDLCQESP